MRVNVTTADGPGPEEPGVATSPVPGAVGVVAGVAVPVGMTVGVRLGVLVAVLLATAV